MATREGSVKEKKCLGQKLQFYPKACSGGLWADRRHTQPASSRCLQPAYLRKNHLLHQRLGFPLHVPLLAAPAPATQVLRFNWDFLPPALPSREPGALCAPSKVLACCFVNTDFSSCFLATVQTSVALAGKKTLVVNLSRNILALHTCCYG